MTGVFRKWGNSPGVSIPRGLDRPNPISIIIVYTLKECSHDRSLSEVG
jgi:hypothetical protein